MVLEIVDGRIANFYAMQTRRRWRVTVAADPGGADLPS